MVLPTRLPLGLLLLISAGAQALPACPAVAGRYRVSGSETALPEVMQALALQRQGEGALDFDVEATPDGRVLSFGLRPARDTGRMLGGRRTLSAGTEFDCSDGWVVMRQTVRGARRTDSGYLEGHTTVRFRPGARGALAFELRFSGGERTTVYAYDSARVSVPKPFTGRTLVETLSWLPASEAGPPPAPRGALEAATRATAQADEALRNRLGSLIGSSMLGVVKGEGNLLRVQLRATRSEHVIDTEDRLRASGLAYEVVVEPRWYNNAHHSEILVRPGRAATPPAPSAFRVSAELDRLLSGAGHVVKAEREGEGYVALVALVRTSPEQALARVAGRSPLLGEVRPDGTERDVAGTTPRTLERWRVGLRR